jgi:hypothetical protein
MRSMARVSKDGRAAHPPSLLRNFGATSIGLPSRSPQGEGWFETALKKRLLTMRFPCGRAKSPVSSKRINRRPVLNALLPPQRGCGCDAVEPLERQDRLGELLGAVLQHRASELQEFLLHCPRVRE